MSKETTYFVRWKGQQLGPYSRQVIEQKVRDHELSLAHEIEVDGRWRSLRGFLNLQAQAQEQERQKMHLRRVEDELDSQNVELEQTRIRLKKTAEELEQAKQQEVRIEPPSRQVRVGNTATSSNPIDQLIRRVNTPKH
jgi:hypothetical protein